ncbi:MAG: hypothetical protein AAGA37_06575 [Actinomycetota bacterium]
MSYPLRRLGDVLQLDLDVHEVEPTREYRIAGVLGFGRGVFEREPIFGSETKYPNLTRLRADTVVYSKLKAFEGAIGVVSPGHAGAFVSAEFPTFRCSDEASVEYMTHVCRWPSFWQLLADSSKGVGARRERLSPGDFLAKKIPLPDIDEQRRVARHLDGVAERLRSVSALRKTTATRLAALGVSLATRPQLSEEQRRQQGWRQLRLGDVMVESQEVVDVALDGQYPNLGIYSFGRGVFAKPPIDGLETSAKRLNRVRSGQFIYSRLFAFEGAYAHVPPEFDGVYVSGEFPSFDVNPDLAEAPFIAAALRSPRQWGVLAGSSKGLGLRRQRIKVEALLEHRLWFPPVEEQQKVVAGLDQIHRLEGLVAHSNDLSAALMPSALNRAFAGLA